MHSDFLADTPLTDALRPSPNVEPRRGGVRPSILLLHYTGVASAEQACDWLCRPESKVSCHYLVDEQGRITQMVPEALRAWHAGASFWAGETDINSASIGIEIHNPGHGLGYVDFGEKQMIRVEALCRDIIARNGIAPERVLAHSDVAPSRKRDPGEKFDWARLARGGVGHWVDPAPVPSCSAGLALGARGAEVEVEVVQRLLSDYGYGVPLSGELDSATQKVVVAFQRHFRPTRVDGQIDGSTVDTLERLIAALPAPRVA